jgi:hypothetical protein
MSLRLDEARFLAALAIVKARYPRDVFPEDGTSLDCKTARLIRQQLECVWEEYRYLKKNDTRARKLRARAAGKKEKAHA